MSSDWQRRKGVKARRLLPSVSRCATGYLHAGPILLNKSGAPAIKGIPRIDMMTAETLPELAKPDANSTSRAAPPSARLVTVFEDAGNYNIKHPLQYSWCLWHRPAGGRGGNTDWTQSLKKIQTCGAVEDFW